VGPATTASIDGRNNGFMEPKLIGTKSCTNIFEEEGMVGENTPFHRGRLAIASFHEYNKHCTNEKIDYHQRQKS
jgi:hypothetical protein